MVIEIVTLVLQAFGALAILGGLLYTIRTHRIAVEGHITDRFNNAISHLGSTELAMRLGGIYALERIANDSDKDYWNVIEIVTAFLRVNSPAAGPMFRPLPEDVKAVIRVIVRRKYSRRTQEPAGLDLRDTYLGGADLANCDLEGADLSGSILVNAILEGVNLRRSELRNVSMQFTHLRKVNLDEANLSDANLHRSSIRQSSLESAFFIGTNLEDCIFVACDMRYTSFLTSNLAGSLFYGAVEDSSMSIEPDRYKDLRIDEAYVEYHEYDGTVNLKAARFRRANLTNTHFGRSIITRVDIEDCVLDGTNLSLAQGEPRSLRASSQSEPESNQ